MSRPLQNLCVLVLAAGAARRMRGADKALETIDGTPLLRRIADMAVGTDLPVFITLPETSPPRLAALSGSPAQIVTVADAATGLAASLRSGIAATPKDAAILLLLADMPEVDAADLWHMIEAHRAAPGMLLRGASRGVAGHPVVFPVWAKTALMQIEGDNGAKAFMKANADQLRLVPLPDAHATTDLDTPEDWARWRAARKQAAR